jgi:hypothetical protein
VPTPARACLGDPPDPSQEDRTTATDANAAAPMIAAPARTLMPQQYASGEGFPNQQTEPSSSSGPIPSIHRSGADHATPVSRVGPMRAHSSPAGDALGNDQETYARAAWRVLLSRDSERASKGSAHARAGTASPSTIPTGTRTTSSRICRYRCAGRSNSSSRSTRTLRASRSRSMAGAPSELRRRLGTRTSPTGRRSPRPDRRLSCFCLPSLGVPTPDDPPRRPKAPDLPPPGGTSMTRSTPL